MKYIALILLSIINWSLHAQKENYNWTLSFGNVLNFNTNPPTVNASITSLRHGISCISDRNGQLVLYVGDHKIYDKNNIAIYTITKELGTARFSSILPCPGQNGQYYVVDVFCNDLVPVLKYKTVAVKVEKLATGEIKVLEKNHFSDNEFVSSLTIIKHANNRDYWLLEGRYGEYIDIYSITSEGIHFNNSFTLLDPIYIGYEANNNAITVTPDLSRLIYRDSTSLYVSDFNNQTGSITKSIRFDDICDYITTTAVSPNGQKLFVAAKTLNNAMVLDSCYIIQYNLDLVESKQAFLDSRRFVCHHTEGSIISDMQMGPNEKLYINDNSHFLGTIENPDSIPPKCYCKMNAVPLNGKPNHSFPNCISSALNYSYHIQCLIVTFRYIGHEAISTAWSFGDGNTSVEMSPVHSYAQARKYTVTLSVQYTNGGSETISKEIEVYEQPALPIILKH